MIDVSGPVPGCALCGVGGILHCLPFPCKSGLACWGGAGNSLKILIIKSAICPEKKSYTNPIFLSRQNMLLVQVILVVLNAYSVE